MYLNQDIKNIEFFKQDMKKYQPGVFEPGLVPDMYISEEKQDLKSKFVSCLFLSSYYHNKISSPFWFFILSEQRREDAMRLSALRFKFKSRANQLIAKKNEVESKFSLLML